VPESRIRDGLERALELGEVGVQVAAYLGDRLIVDDAIGLADSELRAPVRAETLFPAFSLAKSVVATCVHLQAERGRLDPDQPVAAYWPEFGRNGKEGITIRHVLTHRAGLPQVPADLELDDLEDWSYLVRLIAAQAPVCPPGTRSMYHTITFGYILGEVVRRTDPANRGFAEFVKEEITAPLGIDDLWFGLRAEHDPRVATLTAGASADPAQLGPAMNPIRASSIGNVRFLPEQFNRATTRRLEFPSAGIIMNARSGARFFSLLAGGGAANGARLLSRERVLDQTRPRPDPKQVDEALGYPVWLGVGGYFVGGESPPAHPCIGSGPHVLAMAGAGGAIGWADLDTGLAVMINHNRMFGEVPIDRHPFVPLANAVREVAGGIGS
jgi:CubicO group peptidase (beta-lactamase class C family)